MINNPKLIESIKKKIKNVSFKDLDLAIKRADEEFEKWEIEYKEIKNIEYNSNENSLLLIDNEDYFEFYLHKNSTSNFITRLFTKQQKTKKIEVAA